MTQSIAILGRQPALGVAELERLHGADALHPIASNLVLLDKDPADIDFKRLGGTVKLAKLLTRFDTTDWRKLASLVTKALPEYLESIPEGKIRLGLNAYGLPVNVQELNRTGLQFKKTIKQTGRSVRVVPNSNLELNSAQTMHNQLAGPSGLELVFIRDGSETVVAQVVAVQDINAYTARDQSRPKRDARVGMLPPKLAQIIINLAKPPQDAVVLDPFCGTGVVLQEALLMGFSAYGTDLEPRMVEYSQANLDWLPGRFGITIPPFKLATGDATSYPWESFQSIACETYLGRPFSVEPKPAVLGEVMRDVDTIHRKFLKHVATQTTRGFTMCIAVPAWITRNGVLHLKCLDSLEDLGYTRWSFVHGNSEDLIYHRDGQIVGRELVIITRK